MDWNKLPHAPSNALLIDSGRRWGVACNVTALSPATVTQGDLYHDHLNVYGKRLLGKLAFLGKASQSHIPCCLPSVG